VYWVYFSDVQLGDFGAGVFLNSCTLLELKSRVNTIISGYREIISAKSELPPLCGDKSKNCISSQKTRFVLRIFFCDSMNNNYEYDVGTINDGVIELF